MSYTKHNFTTGGIVQAAPFNEMEDQIASNESNIGVINTSLSSVLTQIATLIPQLVFSSASHNGAATVTAINNAITAMNASTPITTTYSITKTLSNCSISNNASTITSGSSYSATVSANNGYTLSAVTVTMGGNNITSSAYNSSTGAISIASVSGNIVITGTAEASAQTTVYTVTNTLTHCTNSNSAVSAAENAAYSGTLSADTGYTLGTATVTMGGVDITSSAYSNGAISIAAVTGNIVITASATAVQPAYTANAVYTNFTATGARFSTDNLSINFTAGDYVEAKINATACTTDATNIFTVAKSGSNDYLDYSTGEGVLIYKRLQSGVDKILFRVKDTANSVAIDKWVIPANMSDLTIKLDKNGVYLDGTKVSGISASDLAFLTGQSAIAVGARASKLSYATYSSVTIYRAS